MLRPAASGEQIRQGLGPDQRLVADEHERRAGVFAQSQRATGADGIARAELVFLDREEDVRLVAARADTHLVGPRSDDDDDRPGTGSSRTASTT